MLKFCVRGASDCLGPGVFWDVIVQNHTRTVQSFSTLANLTP